MLPDYPLAKAKIEMRMRTAMRRRAEARSLPLAKIKPMILHEGTNTYVVRADGSTDNTPMIRSQAKIEIKDEEAIQGPPAAMADKFLNAADDLAAQITRHFFSRVGEAADSVGNVIKLEGGRITGKALLAMFDKLLVDFDDEGHPDWPTIVAAPSNQPHLEAAFRQLEEDPECRKQLDELIQRKRSEHRARESNRRLVE